MAEIKEKKYGGLWVSGRVREQKRNFRRASVCCLVTGTQYSSKREKQWKLRKLVQKEKDGIKRND